MLFKKFTSKLAYFGLFASLLLSVAHAADFFSEKNSLTSVDGIRFYRPDEFFEKFESPHFQEMKDLPESTRPDVKAILNYLDGAGIPIGIGVSSNRETSFDLLAPMVTYADGRPETRIGLPPESGVGHLYFLLHDAVHQYGGVPGARLADLKNLEETKRRFIAFQLENEIFATGWSSHRYIKPYWNQRNKKIGVLPQAAFEKYNNGMFPGGPAEMKEWLDIFSHTVKGEPLKSYQSLQRNMDPKFLKGALDAGVPTLFNRMDSKLSPSAERFLVANFGPAVEAVRARFSSYGGYPGFYKYAEAVFDYTYQPWNVKWADRFQWGTPLDQADRELRAKTEDLIEGRPFSDVKPAARGRFEASFLRNEIALFARRIAEFREYAAQGKLARRLSLSENSSLDHAYENAAKLNDQLLVMIKQDRFDEGRIASARKQGALLLREMETHFDVPKLIPPEKRLPHAVYDHYWTDSTSFLFKRPSPLVGDLVPQKIAAHAAKLGSEKTASKKSTYYLDPFLDDISRDYQKTQAEAKPEKVARTVDHGGVDYLRKLDLFKADVHRQIHEVAIPQIVDNPSLGEADRKAVIDALRAFDKSAGFRIDHFGQVYQSVFLGDPEKSPFKKDFMDFERTMIRGVDRGLEATFNILNTAASGKGASSMKKDLSELSTVSAVMADPKQQLGNPVLRDLVSVLPLKDSRMKIACRFGLDTCVKGTGLMNAFQNLDQKDFIRGHTQEKASYSGWNPAQADKGKGIYILGINHDYAFYDPIFAKKLAEDMGAQDMVVLTNDEAWPHLKIRKERDPNVIFRHETNPGPIERLILRAKELEAQGKKVVILVAPEGQVPSWFAQAPVTTKLGLHVTARKLAVEMKDVAPVYYVEAISNGLEQITGDGDVPMKIQLTQPIEVPNGPLSKNDAWVSEYRLKFEEHANTGRGVRQVDLIHRRFSPGSSVPVAEEVKPYVPVSKWLTQYAPKMHARPVVRYEVTVDIECLKARLRGLRN